MKKLYLVQVLLKDKQDLVNYQYAENYKIAQDIAQRLREDKLICPDFVRVIEVSIICKIMKKVYQIIYYYRRTGGAIAYKSKLIFRNKLEAQLYAHKICLKYKLFFKLEEYTLM